MNLILLSVLVLLIIAVSSVWWTPKSAEYVSEMLWRRACALQASRVVYKHVNNAENLGRYMDDAVAAHARDFLKQSHNVITQSTTDDDFKDFIKPDPCVLLDYEEGGQV